MWHLKGQALFNPITATAILKIILSPYPHNDKWFWTKEKNGRFPALCIQVDYKWEEAECWEMLIDTTAHKILETIVEFEDA